MSVADPSMDDFGRARERTHAERTARAKWSSRRTLAFVVVASTLLWGLIIAFVLHLR